MKTTPSFILLIALLTAGHCRLISHHEESLENEHQQIVNVKPFSNVSNLAANNWILGNMTLDQYNTKRFEITKKFNTSLCPNQTPYVLAGKNICQECPSSAPIFNLQKETCIICPLGQIFDQNTNQCQNINKTKVSKNNQNLLPLLPNATLTNTSHYANISNLEGCNWVLGNMTLNQYYAKRFTITKNYNTSLCPISTPYVLAGKKICQECPPTTPIFALQNDTCIGCPVGKSYDIDANQCKNDNETGTKNKIKSPSPLNATLTDNRNFVNISNLDANSWVLGNLTRQQYYIKRFQITKKVNTSLCPVEEPYVLSGKTICQKCPVTTPIFSLQNDTCIGCQIGEIYNNIKNECQNKNYTLPLNARKQFQNTGPFDGPLINVSGYSNITNLDGSNWILGNMTIEQYYAKRFSKVSKQNTSQCDIDTPYVIEGHGGICQQCPYNKPIFVLQNSTCISCPNGLTWNQNYTNCSQPFPTNVSNATNASKPNKNDTKVTSGQPLPYRPANISSNSSEKYIDIDICDQYQQCTLGKYFNYQQNRCQLCQFGQYFDQYYQTCLFCSQQTPYLDSTFKCVSCPSGHTIDRTTNHCT